MRALVLVVIVSCGGQVAGTDDGGTQSDSASGTDFCASMKARADGCHASFDSAGCANTKACIETAIRADVQSQLEACLVASPCGQTSDACLTSLGASSAAVDPFASYETKCAAKRAACASFPDDYCADKYALAKPEVIAKMSACMELACDGVPSCFDGVLSGYQCHN